MTRKIELQMNAAISNNINWSKDNTRVEFDPETGESKVYLHGNHIADVGENYVRLFDGGWQSNTTKSRINAILGEHVVDICYHGFHIHAVDNHLDIVRLKES